MPVCTFRAVLVAAAVLAVSHADFAAGLGGAPLMGKPLLSRAAKVRAVALAANPGDART